ncbi:MAG: hypothetical protein M3R17_04790, partial [Bacteroidota bacterium]|nr:hypothetical protein [Bacteroidota bacterium]
MQIDKFSDKWLYQDHSKSEIGIWVRHLKYFYFVRAWGGHNNDGDRFVATFGFETKENLLETLNRLGVNVSFVAADEPQPIPGVSYPSADYRKFKILVKQFPDIEQPGITTINNLPCHIYIGENYIQISVSGTKDGNSYQVSSSDFEVAQSLELFFDTSSPNLERHFEIEKNAACISRTKYPELLEEGTSVPFSTFPKAGL